MTLQEITVGTERTDRDECRRYRPIQISFDTRSTFLDQVIDEDWEPGIQAQWRRNQSAIRMELLAEHGTVDGETKIDNYAALGPAPWSIAYEHTPVLQQVRSAFAHGDYYPALVGACALGERIFNQLILALRDDYVNHSSTTKRVRSKDSFTDWGAAVAVLHGWGVLDVPTRDIYLELEALRHASVHFDPTIDATSKEPALRAIRHIQTIVASLFPAAGGPPFFISGTVGASFFARSAEAIPLIRRIFLPRSALVSPHHGMHPEPSPTGGVIVRVLDDVDYSPAPLTDSEFTSALTYV